MSKARAWYESFFDGLYAQVLAAGLGSTGSLSGAQLVKRLLKVRKGHHVLDVPCGQGRLTVPMAALGLNMTGVDLTPSYVRRARRLAKAEGASARFVCADMRETGFEGEFDAAFSWAGFGYFDDEGDIEFCRELFRALKPGGRVLIDGQNKSSLLANFQERHEEVTAGVEIVCRRTWNDETNRVLDRWTFSKGGKTERRELDIRFYNGAEIRRVLRAAGFGDIELYGDLHAKRFTRHSPRWVAVANKK